MQKTILAWAICALVPTLCIAVAHADEEEIEFVEEETRSVGKRMTCDDIKAEMNRLSAMEELDEENSAQLETLKTDYRSKCTKRAGGRSVGRANVAAKVSRGTKRVPVTENSETEEIVEEEKSENTSVEIKDTAKETKPQTGSVCDNPDENGCCPGETYTDLGEQGFNCCTENKEQCFPPVTKDYSLCDDGTEPDDKGCCAGETYKDLGELGFNCCTENNEKCFPPIKK